MSYSPTRDGSQELDGQSGLGHGSMQTPRNRSQPLLLNEVFHLQGLGRRFRMRTSASRAPPVDRLSARRVERAFGILAGVSGVTFPEMRGTTRIGITTRTIAQLRRGRTFLSVIYLRSNRGPTEA
jgi:hypothetical protein